ncbi:UDP-3-O-acyl-N-acetylglucosamine deacetylase [Thalassoglobus sp. JC818]|uniref:UDP-3-O-acyl-N-acetylglucosamine deacetylase n=1 Tax=Thalassoglobus sp. JC818 TaxID=3232136 RepID=UPI00345B33CA
MLATPPRRQRTIARTAKVSGYGLFGGIDVSLEFCPADPDVGIVFERTDLTSAATIPALIEFVVPQSRCTMIQSPGGSVQVIEHVMAALAGLQIDNCLVRIDAPEPPACDGSSQAFVEALLSADIVEQDVSRACVELTETLVVVEDDFVGIGAQPPRQREYEIGFLLDYGDGPISQQSDSFVLTPEVFIQEIASCRTFVLESEVRELQKQGIGKRSTPQNVLVFGEDGIVENSLRFENECARHKILDCIGDFALLGCDLAGRFVATRSGHRLNHAMIRAIRKQALALNPQQSTFPHPQNRPAPFTPMNAAG